MKLIYRAQSYDYTPRPVPPYRKPRAINWRFQVGCETSEGIPRPVPPYRKARAINWRFQPHEV
jgi:hypothetical protein